MPRPEQMLASRRRWLKDAITLAGLGTACGPRIVSARPRDPRRIAAAIASICCDGFEDENFRHTFSYVPQLGVRDVEFHAMYAHLLTPAGLADLRTRCRRHRVRPISLRVSGLAPGDSHKDLAREVSRMMWLFEACRRLGCPMIKVTGAERGTQGGLPALIELLAEVAPIAEQAGVRITIENHKNNNLESLEDFETVFEAVDSRAVGMCLDMGHFHASEVDIHRLIDRLHSRINHMDVKDNSQAGRQNFVRFGEGTLPVDEIIHHCVEKGYAGHLVLELSLQEHATVLADLRAGLAITRKYETDANRTRTHSRARQKA